MTNERGFLLSTIPKLWLVLGIIVALSTLFFGVKSLIENYGQARYDQGINAERAKWQARESKELSEANKVIAFLNERYRALEDQNARSLNAISARYQKELKNAKIQRDRDVAAVHAGTLVLRDPGNPSTTGQGSSGNPVAETGPTTPGRNAAPGTELSVARVGVLSNSAATFILGLAGEADEVVIQLGRCQDVIEADRKL